MEGRRFYQPELDCLRFMAFLGVFLYHCVPGEPRFYKGWPRGLVSFVGAALTAGGFGVAVFFALSAYLITTLLLRERGSSGDLDMRSFYIRRILRIWPLYFGFLALAGLLPFIVHSQHLSATFIVGYSLLAGNWVCVFLGFPISVAGPLWTVSIEEQFYLTWPLVVRRATRASIAKVAIGLLVAANASRIVSALEGAPVRVDFNTLSRIDPIALGILVALAFDEAPYLSTLKRTALFLCSISVVIALARFLDFDKSWGDALGYPLAAFASAGVLISFLGSTNRWIRSPALLYLGKISYGLYVFHLFGWLCANHLLREPPGRQQTIAGRLEIAAVALVITVIAASMSYRWIERPFLRLKERFAYVQSRPV